MPRQASERENTEKQDARHLVSKTFEENTVETLREQDKTLEKQNQVLDRIEKKLEAPILNGGFDDMVLKVTKIEFVQDQMKEASNITGKQVSDIHTTIYDPEKGIYVKVKAHGSWINRANKGIVWLSALLVTGILTGVGKMLYDLAHNHIRYVP